MTGRIHVDFRQDLTQGWKTCCLAQSSANTTALRELPRCEEDHGWAERCKGVLGNNWEIDPMVLYYLLFYCIVGSPLSCMALYLGVRRHGFWGEHEKATAIVVPMPAMVYAIPAPATAQAEAGGGGGGGGDGADKPD